MITVGELAKQSREVYDKSGTFDTKWNYAISYRSQQTSHFTDIFFNKRKYVSVITNERISIHI